jgi:hypothetical protein
MNIGGVLYPIILHQLIPRLGFGWATRVLALITLVTLTVPVAVMRMRVVPKARRALVDLSAFRDAPFVLFTVGCFFIFMGLYIPMFYVQSFAIEEGITSENLAFYMLSIINAASVFGRLVPNFIADTVGPLNCPTGFLLVSGEKHGGSDSLLPALWLFHWWVGVAATDCASELVSVNGRGWIAHGYLLCIQRHQSAIRHANCGRTG